MCIKAPELRHTCIPHFTLGSVVCCGESHMGTSEWCLPCECGRSGNLATRSSLSSSSFFPHHTSPRKEGIVVYERKLNKVDDGS